jgi:hypothetical protein
MLRMSASILNQPVMSLRVGAPIAVAIEPIINPHNLKIIGWWCKTPDKAGSHVLLVDDIREMMPNGFAVDDELALSSPEDLVRHSEILKIHFELMDKQVKTKRQKLGKVADYSYNDGLFVQKLYVERPLRKVFTTDDTIIIDRTQIVEVTNKHILVRDVDVKAVEKEMSRAIEPAVS